MKLCRHYYHNVAIPYDCTILLDLLVDTMVDKLPPQHTPTFPEASDDKIDDWYPRLVTQIFITKGQFCVAAVVTNTLFKRGVLTINFALGKIYSVLVMLSDVCSSFYDANCQNVIVRGS